MTELDYLREACRYASGFSDDPRTQNGAVLVSGKRMVYATNRIPPGVAHESHRLEPPLKYSFIEHAERGAIYAAAAAGVPTAGAILYCPWFACVDCARAIILAGIKEVVGLAVSRNATPQRWADNVNLAEAILREAGVGQRWLAGEVGVTMIFDGRAMRC